MVQDEELWPGSGISLPPDWNHNGVLGGMKDFQWPSGSLDFLLGPDDKAAAGDPPVTVQDSNSLMHPAAMPIFGPDRQNPLQDATVCPWPGLLATYKLGGKMESVGGKAITDGAVTAAVTAPGYVIPGAEPIAAAGTVAGGFGIGAGRLMSTGGGILQGVSGLGIGLQTGNWTPLAATVAPMIASKVSPLNPLIGPTLEDKLQNYIESRGPSLESCLTSAY